MGDAFGFPAGVAELEVGRVAPSCGPGEGWSLGGLVGQPANCRDVWETGLGLGEELGLVVGRGASRGCLRPDVFTALLSPGEMRWHVSGSRQPAVMGMDPQPESLLGASTGAARLLGVIFIWLTCVCLGS